MYYFLNLALWRSALSLTLLFVALVVSASDYRDSVSWKDYQTRPNFKAYFWDSKSRKYGYAYGHSDLIGAITAASRFCADAGGRSCQIKDMSGNGLVKKMAEFATAKTNKAVALSLVNGSWGMATKAASEAAARKMALEACERQKGPRLYRSYRQ